MGVVDCYSGSMTTTEKPIPTPDQMLLARVEWVVSSINALLDSKGDPQATTIPVLAGMVADDLESLAGTVRRRWVR